MAQANENLPRLTRLLALAHRWKRLIDEGVIGSNAEIASLMGISRARVTQIMDLLYLASDIQEHILFMPDKGVRDIPERNVRRISKLCVWKDQREVWRKTFNKAS